MKKIKAFSLLELVVVMIITSLVITAGYFAYMSSAMRLKLFEVNSSGATDLAQLNFLLTKDFDESATASLVTPRKLILEKDDLIETIYVFEEHSIIRIAPLQSDTFHLTINKVAGTDLEFDRVYISQLNLFFEFADKDISLEYAKNYFPAFYLNHSN